MKRIFLILGLILTYNFSFAQQGWVPVTVDPYVDIYFDFSFPNSQTGYGLSVGFQVIKTTDGGLSWNVVASEGRDVQAIYFVNSETGFVSGDYGMIFKTTNGGYNWDINFQSNDQRYIDDIFFSDENTGYACSLQEVYKTTNQGNSWDTLRNGLSNWLFKIYFVNNNTGFVSGYDGIFKTTNGGLNWFNVSSINAAWGLTFINEVTGYAGRFFSDKIYKTTNSGNNWDIVFSDDTLDVHCIFTIGADTIYAGTDKASIIKSTNAGLTWKYQFLNVQTTGEITGLYFIDGNTGFCAGGFSSPFFFYTTTGGTVGIQPIGGEIPSSFRLHQNYPNPFNPETRIRFEIPAQVNSTIKLTVYNSLGQEVKVLVNEKLQPGNYEYSFNVYGLPSGVYYYSLGAGEFTATKKMIVLK